MEGYVKQLGELASHAGELIIQEQADILEITRSGIARPDFYAFPEFEDQPLGENNSRFFYVRGWASGVGGENFFPGFIPGYFLTMASRTLRIRWQAICAQDAPKALGDTT